MSDNISRQAALDAVSYETFECYEARKAIRALPSTDRKGHWIVQDTSYWRATPAGDVPVNRVNLKCSCCGYRLHYTKIARKYCPECGADMRGGKE